MGLEIVRGSYFQVILKTVLVYTMGFSLSHLHLTYYSLSSILDYVVFSFVLASLCCVPFLLSFGFLFSLYH